jgi:DNA-binding IclR family transcriptional regulator
MIIVIAFSIWNGYATLEFSPQSLHQPYGIIMSIAGTKTSLKHNPPASADIPGDGYPKGAVPAVVKAVRLLEVLAAAKEPLALASLTDALSLPKSTIHALCATLVHAGLVRRFENGSYHLGSHIMDLSHAFLARTDVTAEFTSLGDSLNLLPEETIILSVLDGSDVVYVSCRNGTRPLGLNFRIGMRLPANCTASGKALLSTLPEERVVELARASGLPALTRKSVTELPALMKQLVLVRRRGYSVDDEETHDGMVCLGAPVFDSNSSHAIAGIGVSLLKSAIDAQQKKAAIHAIQRMASELSKRLGAQGLAAGPSLS